MTKLPDPIPLCREEVLAQRENRLRNAASGKNQQAEADDKTLGLDAADKPVPREA